MLVTDRIHLESLEQEVSLAKTFAADPHPNVIAFYGYITVTRKQQSTKAYLTLIEQLLWLLNTLGVGHFSYYGYVHKPKKQKIFQLAQYLSNFINCLHGGRKKR